MRKNDKKTTCKVTNATLLFENELLKRMDIPKTAFHRRMFDYAIENGLDIHPRLRITDWRDPDYIKRDVMEQIYIDPVREAKLKKIAQENGCTISTVYFQALMTYCAYIAPYVIEEDRLAEMFNIKKDESR